MIVSAVAPWGGAGFETDAEQLVRGADSSGVNVSGCVVWDVLLWLERAAETTCGGAGRRELAPPPATLKKVIVAITMTATAAAIGRQRFPPIRSSSMSGLLGGFYKVEK